MFNFIKIAKEYIVFLTTGKKLTGTPADEQAFLDAIQNENEEKITALLDPEYAKKKALEEKYTYLLEQYPEFKVENGKLYYDKIPYAIPELLADTILNVFDEGADIDPYLKFWSWCALNPNVDSRKQLFNFIRKSGLQITYDGLLVCYRNVKNKQEGDLELTKFVSYSYSRVKRNKKSPKNYFVYRDEDGDLQCKTKEPCYGCEVYGNLQGLYENIEKFQTVFTDNHTGKFQIEIGKPVVMNRAECDPDPKSSCSRGLHLGGASFLKRGNFGSTPIMCLVNPMNAVAVPSYDNWKMRVCEYLPVAVVEYDDNGNIQPFEDVVIDLDYPKYSVEQLFKKADYAHDPEEFDILELAADEFVYETLVDTLKDEIANRVINCYDEEE